MKTMHLLAAASAVAAMAASASAATITETFDITASNFTLTFGDGSVAPVDPVNLDFTITLDPTVATDQTTNGLTVNFFNLPYAVTYAYDGAGLLTVATDAHIDLCNNPPSTFCSFIYNAFGSPTPSAFFQQSTSTGGYWTAQTVNVTATAVPEPAAWALMLLGVGGMGSVLRRRRSAVPAA